MAVEAPRAEPVEHRSHLAARVPCVAIRPFTSSTTKVATPTASASVHCADDLEQEDPRESDLLVPEQVGEPPPHEGNDEEQDDDHDPDHRPPDPPARGEDETVGAQVGQIGLHVDEDAPAGAAALVGGLADREVVQLIQQDDRITAG